MRPSVMGALLLMMPHNRQQWDQTFSVFGVGLISWQIFPVTYSFKGSLVMNRLMNFNSRRLLHILIIDVNPHSSGH